MKRANLHFLSRMLSPTPSQEEVHLLTLRTEGWIAGLQLAALAMQKRADRATFLQAFTGSQRYLLDYVQEEILARLPESARDFLLQSAILWRLDASVCQAVTAAPTPAACQQMLAFLERANLFLVPLDEERRSYRLHDLFREALCACLHASQPELVPLLHLRAARWYEATGELREAIAHAMAAADYSYAALQKERCAPSFWLHGEAQAVHHWLQALPDEILWQHARLALNAALRLLNLSHESTEVSYARTQAQVERTLVRVEAGLHRKLDLGPSDTEGALIERRLRLLQALIELRTIVKHDDPGRQMQLTQEVEGLPQDEDVIWNMIPLSMIFWLTLAYERKAVSLLPRLMKVKQQALESGDFLARIRGMGWLAMTYAQLGQLRKVQQECRQALTLIEQISGHTAMAAYLHISLFHVYYAWNRLQEASEEVSLLKQIGQQWQQMDLQVMGEVYSAHLSLAMGDLCSAQEALHKAEALVEQESYDYYALWVSLLRVQCWLAEANLSLASEWAARTTFALETWDPARTSEFLMLVHVSLAQQKYAQAVAMLERFREQLDRPADIEKTVEFLALYVVALHCADKREQAADVAARLLTLTEPEGCIRVYLDAGEPMKQVLQSLLEAASTKAEQAQSSPKVPVSFLSKLLLAFEQEEKNLRHPPLGEPTPSGAFPFPQRDSSPPHPFVESLTQREQEVLRLLADGASNQQIADALVIELSTVKKHVSNLLSKLGAESRTQAITRARTLSLL